MKVCPFLCLICSLILVIVKVDYFLLLHKGCVSRSRMGENKWACQFHFIDNFHTEAVTLKSRFNLILQSLLDILVGT